MRLSPQERLDSTSLNAVREKEIFLAAINGNMKIDMPRWAYATGGDEIES